MEINYIAIGKRIRQLRKERGWSQAILAEKSGIEPSNISHIERAATKLSLPTLVSISNAYSLTQVPDGFDIIDITRDDYSIVTIYKNTKRETIVFSQLVTESNSGLFFDNENGSLIVETVNGLKVEFKEWNNTKSAIWTNNGYVFSIDCIGSIDFEEIKQMIMYIK